MDEAFPKEMTAGYDFGEPCGMLGRAVKDGEIETGATVQVPLIELTARLIRSKGVGVYFVTQSPTDVPSSVLSQLGNRVQHALRAYTPDDADALRQTARTFPVTEHYD